MEYVDATDGSDDMHMNDSKATMEKFKHMLPNVIVVPLPGLPAGLKMISEYTKVVKVELSPASAQYILDQLHAEPKAKRHRPSMVWCTERNSYRVRHFVNEKLTIKDFRAKGSCTDTKAEALQAATMFMDTIALSAHQESIGNGSSSSSAAELIDRVSSLEDSIDS